MSQTVKLLLFVEHTSRALGDVDVLWYVCIYGICMKQHASQNPQQAISAYNAESASTTLDL